MKYRETEGAKVRRLGFALDEATLKQLAYSKGITQSYESMTQAQKAQLRYVAMIEQAQNIGVTGAPAIFHGVCAGADRSGKRYRKFPRL